MRRPSLAQAFAECDEAPGDREEPEREQQYDEVHVAPFCNGRAIARLPRQLGCTGPRVSFAGYTVLQAARPPCDLQEPDPSSALSPAAGASAIHLREQLLPAKRSRRQEVARASQAQLNRDDDHRHAVALEPLLDEEG